MSYAQQRVLAVAVSVALAMIGAVSLANAETLGLTPQIVAWLTVVSVGLGLLQGFLPNVRGQSKDPEFLAQRIRELPVSDQQRVAQNLADEAERANTTARIQNSIERHYQEGKPAI